ncbi:hypothetical protein [Thermoplasma volcanium]|nr:hypothetical protein [Thermoplasma volcanium]
MDVNQAIEIAKNEIQSRFNVTDVIIKSSALRNGIWQIKTSFILNNEQKYYVININNDTSEIIDMHEAKMVEGNAGSSRTLVTVAYAISILSVIAYIISIAIISLDGIASTHMYSSYGGQGIGYTNVATGALVGLISILVFLIIFLVIDIYIVVRISKIRSYIINGDYESAYQKNSVGFGVVALIFGGLLTGILLLIARGDLERAANS